MTLTIMQPEITRSGNTATLSANLFGDNYRNTLWFEVPISYEKYLVTEYLDAFVLAALPLAMARGENLKVQGTVSAVLHEQIEPKIIPLLRGLVPAWRGIGVAVRDVSSKALRTAGKVATGFSAGIDSLFVLKEYFLERPTSAPDRVSCLLFNDVGSHGKASEFREEKFTNRLIQIQRALDELNLPLVTIRSNIDEILPLAFQQTHSLRNTAAVLSVQKLIERYLYASSYTYKDCYSGQSKTMGTIEPILLPLLSTETTKIVSVSGRFNRTEKTEGVAGLKLTQRHLQTCMHDLDGKNCSKCFKCLRTLFTLELLGHVEDFSEVYDLDIYRRKRFPFLLQVLQEKDAYDADILALAKRKGVTWPWWVHLLSKLYPTNALRYAGNIRRRLWRLFLWSTRAQSPSAPVDAQ